MYEAPHHTWFSSLQSPCISLSAQNKKQRFDVASRCSLDGGPAPPRTETARHASPLPFSRGKFVKIHACCDTVGLQRCVSFCYTAKWASHTHTPLFFGFPSHSGHHGARSSLPCLYSFLSLLTYLIQNIRSVCYDSSQLTPLSPPRVHICSFRRRLHFRFVNKTVCANVFQIPHVCVTRPYLFFSVWLHSPLQTLGPSTALYICI